MTERLGILLRCGVDLDQLARHGFAAFEDLGGDRFLPDRSQARLKPGKFALNLAGWGKFGLVAARRSELIY